MQTIIIAGRLGRDAELRSTQGGDQVCGFTVAVDTRAGREKVTNWWRCSLWGKRAEALSPYLLKGVSVTVSGEFSLGEYDGKPQLNVRVSDLTLQGGRGDTGGGSTSRREPDGSQGHAAPPQDDLDDDIPFITNQGVK